MGLKIKCSECGQEFTITYPGYYQYKVSFSEGSNSSKFPKSSKSGTCAYQCCYTCNDHARLRVNSFEVRRLTRENFIKYVKRSEDYMRAKGKDVIYPIDVDKIRFR